MRKKKKQLGVVMYTCPSKQGGRDRRSSVPGQTRIHSENSQKQQKQTDPNIFAVPVIPALERLGDP